MRHSMTNIYETLGVGRNATEQEIQAQYDKMMKFFHPDVNKDPNAQVIYDDLTLAYNILINAKSRKEFDEYLDQHSTMAGYQRRFTGKDQEEAEKTRKKERGKRRFEEDFDFANDEFFADFQQRTGQRPKKKTKTTAWWEGDEKVEREDG